MGYGVGFPDRIWQLNGVSSGATVCGWMGWNSPSSPYTLCGIFGDTLFERRAQAGYMWDIFYTNQGVDLNGGCHPRFRPDFSSPYCVKIDTRYKLNLRIKYG